MRAVFAVVACLGMGAVLCVPRNGVAQEPHRNGFWIESATGTGAARTACASCEAVTVAYGSASHLRAGVSISSRVKLGIEVFALHSAETVLAEGLSPVDAENAMIAPIVLWYVGESGFFLKGGAGVARGTFTVVSPSGAPATATRTGSGLTFGIGFDIGLLKWLALTANLGTYITAIGDTRVGANSADDIIATIYEAGIGITIR